MHELAKQAADQLSEQGVSAEIIDPRTLEPLDIATITESVTRTGRLVVIDEDTERCSVGAEIAAQVMEQAFHVLKGPILRVANPNFPVPYSPPLEQAILPSVEKIIATVYRLLKEY